MTLWAQTGGRWGPIPAGRLLSAFFGALTVALAIGMKRMARRNVIVRRLVAVGAVVIKDGAILLVKRGQAPSSGKWAIPGGSVELGETLQQAAEREIREETGLRIRAEQPVFTFDVIERDRHLWIAFSRNKKQTELIRVPLDALDKLRIPPRAINRRESREQ